MRAKVFLSKQTFTTNTQKHMETAAVQGRENSTGKCKGKAGRDRLSLLGLNLFRRFLIICDFVLHTVNAYQSSTATVKT
jgi:hypothetical protein